LYNISPAKKYYQLGLSEDEAVALGADRSEFRYFMRTYAERSLTVFELYDYKQRLEK